MEKEMLLNVIKSQLMASPPVLQKTIEREVEKEKWQAGEVFRQVRESTACGMALHVWISLHLACTHSAFTM